MLTEIQVQCPYCGEQIDALVDGLAGSHRYIEDCSVCCRPIEFEAVMDASGDLVRLAARRDDD
ncbi:MAG: CPXCG motif-containing cysteine-rich protein [Lamprobacter sp.]|uniref:CPXCG motif-containing cysteine-rich protein n=1 Tax=Lamprobacter sp. TaxID=3100796 RepID=UPI002B261E09|nr:CPXCG motif-containing cysteine-rich protein [Lamprobacter sp.]MEA3639144.1 CPXCG motif-containing cysteine-rich protein [Lamprobacter sp.]